MENARKEIIDKVTARYPLKNTTLEFEKAVNQALDKLVWMPIYPKISVANPIAFATRSGGLTGVYEIYVNPKIDTEVAKYFELHEKGHIIFTHLSLQEAQHKIQVKKILTYWSKIKNHLDLSDAIEKAKAKGKSELEVAEKYSKMIANKMLNIAMDFEVNSKLFTTDEWATMKKYFDYAYIFASASMNGTSQEELSSILKWLNDNENDLEARFTRPCWPEDYEFPLKLTYGEYIDLMLQNIDKFLDKMSEQNGSGGEGQDSENDGDSSSKSGKKKMTAEDIENLQKGADDGDNCRNRDIAENGDKATCYSEDDDGNGGGSDEPRKADAKTIAERTSGAKRGKSGYSPIGNCSDNNIYCEGANNKEVEKFILKNVFDKKVINNRVEYMKVYNRQKYGNVMLASYTKEDIWRPGNVYLLVDCSGSIEEKAINDFISTIKSIAKKCGPKSRIIWWDTCLEGDTLLRENKGPKGCGGTKIASGIDYIKNKYLKNKNDKLIIISDFEDALYQWAAILKTIKNDCIGICWTHSKIKSDVDYLSECGWCEKDSEVIKFLLKKLKTVFVNISA